MHLDRRTFLKTAVAASAASAFPLAWTSAAEKRSATSANESTQAWFELRAYRLKPEAPVTRLDAYLEHAFIPALNARGIANVGVFIETEPQEGPVVWVLIPHPSLDSVARVAALAGDPSVLAAAGGYATGPAGKNPAFDRIDSWLLRAFAGLPQLAVPMLKREGRSRIFELRMYESPDEAKARNKEEMFNAGEIETMQALHMSPVFYGEALVGRGLPRLAYLLCSPDRATHARQWQEFFAHPVWLKLKNDPQYAGNVSKVISRFLTPASYSQI
jgi:hypothetical protein